MGRQQAYKEFDKFANSASRKFHALMANDNRAKFLKGKYSFYADKGGSSGAFDKRVVEVFFGIRAFDSVETFSLSPNGKPLLQNRQLTERGACLKYERVDDGSVICTLYPAQTKDYKPIEDCIYLKLFKTPEKLNKKQTIYSHWNLFISYMVCTSLDCHPTVCDRLRVACYRFIKRQIKDGKVMRAPVLNLTYRVLEFMLSVGLSGFLLAIILKIFS